MRLSRRTINKNTVIRAAHGAVERVYVFRSPDGRIRANAERWHGISLQYDKEDGITVKHRAGEVSITNKIDFVAYIYKYFEGLTISNTDSTPGQSDVPGSDCGTGKNSPI